MITSAVFTSEIVWLAGQRSVIVRPIQPQDVMSLIAMDEQISSESRFLRYCGNAHMSLGEARAICEGDPRRSMALVATPAESPEQIIAIALYIACEDSSPDQAEIAIVVADEWQAMGLGTWLLTHLGAYAVEHSIHTFIAYVHCQNFPILRFIQQIHLPVTRSVTEGIFEIRISLPGQSELIALLERYRRDPGATK
jgi:GNAT superfamily N-acetyltransferase